MTRPLTSALIRPTSRRARFVAGGVLTGVAVGSTVGLLLPESAPDVPVNAAAHTAPSPIVVAPRSSTPHDSRTAHRASRGGGRTALPPKAAPVKAVTPMKYVSQTVATGSTFSGQASWYGGYFQGRTTANGERFDTHDLTAASKTLPFNTRLRVCRLDNCVVVRINDRGPYVGDRVLDLSQAAAQELGYSGVAHVSATPVETKRVAVPDVAAAKAIADRAHRAAVVRRAQAARKAATRRAVQIRAERAAAQNTVLVSEEREAFPLEEMLLPGAGLAMAAGGGLLSLRLRRTSTD